MNIRTQTPVRVWVDTSTKIQTTYRTAEQKDAQRDPEIHRYPRALMGAEDRHACSQTSDLADMQRPPWSADMRHEHPCASVPGTYMSTGIADMA